MNPVQDQDLTPEQVVQLTNTMVSVAMVDGITPAEAVLIREFYENARTEDMPAVDVLMERHATNPFNVSELTGSSREFADTLVLMGLMTAYADGHLSTEERERVTAIAKATGMNDELLSKHLSRVHDDLIGALSHLPDSGSVANVLKSLS
jgi:tellurite resistance protein